MRLPIVFAALVLLADLSLAEEAGSQDNAFIIGLLDNSNWQYVDGCGCTFLPPGKRRIPEMHKLILAARDGKAWIKVNGEVIELKKTYDGISYQGKIGDEYKQRYESADTSVEVLCKAKGFGDTHAVDCDAEITVKRGPHKQTLRAEGDCGC